MKHESGREITILEDALAEFVGDDAWRGLAWEYADVLAAREAEAQAEADVLAARERAALAKREAGIDKRVFVREWSILAAHHGRRDMPEELIVRYFERLRFKMTTEEFEAAAARSMDLNLRWGELIPYLIQHAKGSRS